MKKIQLYLKLASKSFQRSLAYRLEYYIGLANAFLYIFIFTSVWQTVSRENPSSLGGWTEALLIQYAIFSTLIKVSYGRNESLLTAKIKSGDFAYDLLKPYNIFIMFVSDSLGVSLFQLFARALPLLIFSFVFFGIVPSVTAETFLKFLPVYFFSFVLFLCFGFFISCLAFFFTEVFPFMILYSALVTLLSGSVIPLNFFPEAFRGVVFWTPFPYLYYFPTAVLISGNLQMEYSELIIRYLIQTSVMLFLCLRIYFMGLRKVEFAGG